MGSSISILNNTGFELYCIVTPDQAALAWSGIIISVVAALTAIALSSGLLAPTFIGTTSTAGGTAVSTAVSSIVVTNVAINVALVKAILITSLTSGSALAVKSILDKIVTDQVKILSDKGYQQLRPGERFTWGGKTLSLWQQGNCKRIRTRPDSMWIMNDEVFMRPIFSGATANSDLTHDVQFWVDKFGWENRQRLILSPPEGRPSWGNVELSFDEWEKQFANLPPGPEGRASWGNVELSFDEWEEQSSTEATTVVIPTAPTANLKMAPTFPVPFECNVCTHSLTGFVTYPDVIVSIPDNGEFTCAEVETAGKNGLISEANCPLVIQYLRPCGCYLPDQQCWGPLVQERWKKINSSRSKTDEPTSKSDTTD
jgi:hypothetical protein